MENSVIHFYQVDVLKDLNVSRSLNVYFDSVIPASLTGVFLHLKPISDEIQQNLYILDF